MSLQPAHPSEPRGAEEIRNDGALLALFFPKTLRADGATFFTPQDFALQVGIIEHAERRDVPLHRHLGLPPLPAAAAAQEFLFVATGSAAIAITDSRWRTVREITLTGGDAILLIAGGHRLAIEKGTRIIEVKQGPYPGDAHAKEYEKK